MLARTALAVLGSLLLLAGCRSGPTAATSSEPSMVVYNAPPSIFQRDMGNDNRIQGDLIAWHADLAVDLDESAAGAGRATSAKVVGYCTGTMIVTLDARGGTDRQHRMTNIELDWDESPDSLLVAGSHRYKQGQIETDTVIHRAIVGGTGRYAGAMGEMSSTRLPNGWYRHEIRFVD
ncbi:MAG: hypothetical protein VX672_07545 [Planctomycetota bacterium]|nr:hypothetical protein [Planctomycetota bacterium]